MSSRAGDFFAVFAAIFFSELVLGGMAMVGLERPRLAERERLELYPRPADSWAAGLLRLLPAKRSSREISLVARVAPVWAPRWPYLECLIDERILKIVFLLKVYCQRPLISTSSTYPPFCPHYAGLVWDK